MWSRGDLKIVLVRVLGFPIQNDWEPGVFLGKDGAKVLLEEVQDEFSTK